MNMRLAIGIWNLDFKHLDFEHETLGSERNLDSEHLGFENETWVPES